MSIVPLADFKVYLRDELAAATDDTIQQGALDAADLAINSATFRQFAIAGAASSRVFAPRSITDVLRIHDCTSVTAVVNDTMTVLPADYQLEPLNGILMPSGEARPYDQIRYLSRQTASQSFYNSASTGNVWLWDSGRATVTITATWGWAAIPVPIYEALKVLAKDIAGNRNVQNGIVGFTDAGAAAARTNTFVRAVIHDYRREEAKAGLGGSGR